MKPTLTIIIMLFSFLVLQAQELLKPKMEMKIDSIGNADIKISMTMNANQWQMWSQTFGNNPALLKRNIEKEMPGFFLDDYKLEKNDMERSFNFTFKAYGVCEVNKKGTWIVSTEQKNPDLTQLTDHKYMMVSTDVANGMQETTIIEFPESAKNIKQTKDAFDKTQFEFDMKEIRSGINWFLWIGILLAVAGGGWAGLISFTNKQPKNTPPM